MHGKCSLWTTELNWTDRVCGDNSQNMITRNHGLLERLLHSRRLLANVIHVYKSINVRTYVLNVYLNCVTISPQAFSTKLLQDIPVKMRKWQTYARKDAGAESGPSDRRCAWPASNKKLLAAALNRLEMPMATLVMQAMPRATLVMQAMSRATLVMQAMPRKER